MTVLILDLPDELADSLNILSESLGKPIGDIMIDALDAYLDMMEDEMVVQTVIDDLDDMDIPNAS